MHVLDVSRGDHSAQRMTAHVQNVHVNGRRLSCMAMGSRRPSGDRERSNSGRRSSERSAQNRHSQRSPISHQYRLLVKCDSIILGGKIVNR